jgi:hypothetical protein
VAKKVVVKPNVYAIISRAVEEGVNWGWQHAHKHTDKPSEGYLKEQIENDVMNALCEVIKFDE